MIFFIAILVVVFDQVSKLLLSRNLPLNSSVPIIKNFLHLTLVHNTGIAFGVLKDSSRVILLVTIVGLGLIIYSIKKELFTSKLTLDSKELFIRKMSVGLILGGAAGNMIDRLRLGYVIDFLDFRIWPVFNLADSCITVGAVILFWNLYIFQKSTNK